MNKPLINRSAGLAPSALALLLISVSPALAARSGGQDDACGPFVNVQIYVNQSTFELKLWAATEDGAEKPVFFRREAVAVLPGPPARHDGDETWINVNDACPALRDQVDKALKGLGETAKKEEVRERLSRQFEEVAKDRAWSVREREDGWIFARPINDDQRTFVFDCLRRLDELARPSSPLGRDTKGAATDKQAKTLSCPADVRKAILVQGLDEGGKSILYKSRDPHRAGEQLLARSKGEGKNVASFDVLWLPLSPAGGPWSADQARLAFDNPPTQALDPADYERLRSLALFPEPPDQLDGLAFRGFVRDAGREVVVKSELEWRTKAEATRNWRLNNRAEGRYAPRIAGRKAVGKAVTFGPEEEGFGRSEADAPTAPKPDDRSLLVAGNAGHRRYYPVAFTLAPSSEVSLTFRIIIPEADGDRTPSPFYLLDRELTSDQLLALLLTGVDQWWREKERRTQRFQPAKEPAAAGPPGIVRIPEANIEKDPMGKAVESWRRTWDRVGPLTERVGSAFLQRRGDREPMYAAWLLDEVITNQARPLAARAVKAGADSGAADEGPVARYKGKWRLEWASMQVDRLVPLFEHRAFAWAEAMLAEDVSAPNPAPVSPAPRLADLDAEWTRYLKYCWDLYGDAFPNDRDFVAAFGRYKRARDVLSVLGTDFPARSACPLGDPATMVSPAAIEGLMASALRAGEGTLRLPTAGEWASAARLAWVGRTGPAGNRIAHPASGTWTGDRRHPWPSAALRASEHYYDHTGLGSPDAHWDLIGNVAEYASTAGKESGSKASSWAIMGADYRTDLAAPEARDPSSSLSTSGGLGWPFAGFRPVLVPPGSTPGPAADDPTTPAVDLAAPAADPFKEGQTLLILYQRFFGTSRIPGSTDGDPLNERWKIEREVVAEELGGRPDWWAEDLRAKIRGASGGCALQGERPRDALLDDLIRSISEPCPVRRLP